MHVCNVLDHTSSIPLYHPWLPTACPPPIFMSSLIFSHNILSTVSNVCCNTETLLPDLEQVTVAVVSSCLRGAPPILWSLASFCPLFCNAPWALAGGRVLLPSSGPCLLSALSSEMLPGLGREEGDSDTNAPHMLS